MVADLERRLADRTRAAVSGALNRAARTRRPKPRDIDWNRTIAANLSRYVPSHRTVIPERLIGYGRRQQVVARDVILAIDQSGSMASSVVYASVFGAVLASLRSLRTSLVAFDTAVVDLTPVLADPVDVLFGTQLGGGTDINQAVAYCEGLVTRPRDTIFVLISDLYEGGDAASLIARLGALRSAGVSRRGAARAVRRRRAVLRRVQRGGPVGAGHPGVRLHAGRVPRAARAGDRRRGHRRLGAAG